MMSDGVVSWWSLLCAVAALNILAWCMSAVAHKRRRTAIAPEALSARRLQLQLSAVYVFGCAFRSVLPVFDGPRICLFNSWLSSVIVGRSVATCAELCFVAQWALMLRETSRATDSVLGNFASLAVVPLIAVAEACSWYSVLTTSNLGHVAEESIWGLSAALLVMMGWAIVSPGVFHRVSNCSAAQFGSYINCYKTRNRCGGRGCVVGGQFCRKSAPRWRDPLGLLDNRYIAV